jgi:hypothetical protein
MASQKVQLLVFIVAIAVFAAAITPIVPISAQEDSVQNVSEDKTHEDKSGKSCPGKNKQGMTT